MALVRNLKTEKSDIAPLSMVEQTAHDRKPISSPKLSRNTLKNKGFK
jgi:hypothetical protein